jgi:hypothetical protein
LQLAKRGTQPLDKVNNTSNVNPWRALLVHCLVNEHERCEQRRLMPAGLFILSSIVHDAVNEHLVEQDDLAGIVHVVHHRRLALRILDLLNVQQNPPTKAVIPTRSGGQGEISTHLDLN